MYRMLSFAILFLVGLSHREVIRAEINNNGGGLSLSDFGLNRRQFNEIQEVVIDVLRNYISTANNSFTKKDSRQFSLLKLDANLISNGISTEIEKFFRNLGLINSNKKNAETSSARAGQPDETRHNTVRDSIVHELFAFIHKLVPICEEIQSSIQNHLRKNDYHQKGYSPTQLSLPKVIRRNSPHTFKFVSFIDNAEKYLEAYFDCLNTTVTSFDLASAFANLVKHSPRVANKIVTFRMSRPIPRHPRHNHYRDMDAMICRLIMKDHRREVFENCLEQCQLMTECINIKMDKYANITHESKWRSGQRLSRNINILNTTCGARPNNTSTIIICDSYSYRSSHVGLLSLIKKLFGIPFMRSSASQNVVKKLGNLIMKSKLSSEMMEEVNGLVEIYQEAVKKEQYLLKQSRNNLQAMNEYNKYSRQLSQYTKSLYDMILNFIDHIRGITSTVEGALVRTVSTVLGVDLSNNFRAMRSFATFWHNLKNWLTQNSNQPLILKPSIRQDFFTPNRSLTKNHDQNVTDDYHKHIFDLSHIFNRNWFTSMRSIARTNARRKPNTIIALANTFLLATMFYECIVILAGAIYRTENEEDTATRPIHQPIDEQPNENPEFPPYYDYEESPYLQRRGRQILW